MLATLVVVALVTTVVVVVARIRTEPAAPAAHGASGHGH